MSWLDGGCGTGKTNGAVIQIFEPGEHYKGLVGTIVRIAPAIANGRVEEFRQKPVRTYVASMQGFDSAGAMKFSDTSQLIAG